MDPTIFKPIRKSRMNLNEVYFWTNTIKDWNNLLAHEDYKKIIIEQLQWLKERNKIAVYGFVIMPNHLHFLWEMKDMNGKEMPHASFNKWTSSNFLQDLRINHAEWIPGYTERTAERNHRFWKRDPLAVLMDSKDKIEQKLDYIHLNPLQEKWGLAKYPEEYRWSSAKFYYTGEDEFGILTHYMEGFEVKSIGVLSGDRPRIYSIPEDAVSVTSPPTGHLPFTKHLFAPVCVLTQTARQL